MSGTHKNQDDEQISDLCLDLTEHIAVLEKLLVARDRVLDETPECKRHGRCVPHAISWRRTAKRRELFMSDTQTIYAQTISYRNQLHNAMWAVRDILSEAGLWKTPDTKTAFPYAVTEMGEVFDAHLRALRPDDNRNSDREVDFEKELADLWIMLATAYGRSPQRAGNVADCSGGGVRPLINLNHQIAVAYRHFSQGEDYHLFTGTALIMVEQLCPDLARLVVDKLLYIAAREAAKKTTIYLDMPVNERIKAFRSDNVALAQIHKILEPIWRTDD